LESCFYILLKYYDKLYLKSLHSRAIPKNEGIKNIRETELDERDNPIKQEQQRSYSDNYKIEIYSDRVDPHTNSQKLLTAFYGRN